MMYRHGKGFTLIELLVVIAVIAVLVSILMPALQKAKEMAKDVVCRSNQKAVAMGLNLYAETFDGLYPPTLNMPGYQPPLDWARHVGIIDEINLAYNMRDPNSHAYKVCRQGFVPLDQRSPTDGIFRCPSCLEQVEPKFGRMQPPGFGEMRWCVNFSMNGNLSNEYAYSLWYSSASHPPRGKVKCVSIANVRSQTVLIGECNLRTASAPEMFPLALYRMESNGNLRNPSTYGPWQVQKHPMITASMNIDFYGHPGERFNLCFVDAHVESVSNNDIDVKAWRR